MGISSVSMQKWSYTPDCSGLIKTIAAVGVFYLNATADYDLLVLFTDRELA